MCGFGAYPAVSKSFTHPPHLPSSAVCWFQREYSIRLILQEPRSKCLWWKWSFRCLLQSADLNSIEQFLVTLHHWSYNLVMNCWVHSQFHHKLPTSYSNCWHATVTQKCANPPWNHHVTSYEVLAKCIYSLIFGLCALFLFLICSHFT
jgi:hypothetical protein